MFDVAATEKKLLRNIIKKFQGENYRIETQYLSSTEKRLSLLIFRKMV